MVQPCRSLFITLLKAIWRQAVASTASNVKVEQAE